MESYSNSLRDNAQVLDFTSCLKREKCAESSEPPVLDLSCKKQTVPMLNKLISHNKPADTEKEEINNHFVDPERKSPFEGRTFMVTPPSESESPKKIKYESIYNCSNPSVNVIGQHGDFSALPMNIPIPAVPAVLPVLLSQNGGTVKPIQVGATSSISTTTPTTYCKEMALTALSPDTGTAELMYDQNSTEAYSEFRKRMLDSVRRSNEGTNIKMRRSTKSPGLPTSTVDEKDAAYWERRRKNNEAAKRSRDARRAKEDEIAIRAAFLEQENIKLKYELVALRNETAKLRCMVYST